MITGGKDWITSSSSAFAANYVDFFSLDTLSWTRLADSSYGQWGHQMAIYDTYEAVEETRSPRPVIIGGDTSSLMRMACLKLTTEIMYKPMWLALKPGMIGFVVFHKCTGKGHISLQFRYWGCEIRHLTPLK